MEGVTEGLDPGEPVEDLVYDWGPGGQHPGARRLPRNLLEAIEAFDADPLTHDVFPAPFIAAYVEMKLTEWDSLPRPGFRLGAADVPGDVLMGGLRWEDLTGPEITAALAGRPARGWPAAGRGCGAARPSPADRDRHRHRHQAG